MGTISFVYVRAAAIVYLLFVLLSKRRLELRPFRVPLALLLALAAWMTMQLIPIPPAMWTALPMRDLLVMPSPLLGATPWRSISLSPDATINSLLSLLIPLAAITGYSALTVAERRQTVLVVLALTLFSAVLGIIQFAGGADSWAYLYERRSEGVPIGIFSNRNHQAVFLAVGIVLTGAVYRSLSRDHGRDPRILAIVVAVCMFFMANVVATGSRTGTALSLAALLYSVAMIASGGFGRSRKAMATILFSLLLAGGLLMLLLYFGRAVSLDRLLAFDASSEQRVQSMPVMLKMLDLFWLLGSGFGTFDPAYRVLEPDILLHQTYFNHAHNDWLEIVLTGGVPAALIVLTFTAWVAFRARQVFGRHASADTFLARAAAVTLALLGLASIVDYPLRTPFLSALAALGSCWLAKACSRSADASLVASDRNGD